MFEVKIESQAVMGALERIATGVANAAPLMRSIATEMLSQTEANFAAEGRPHWLGLKPSTIAERTKQGTWPGKILQRSAGGLAASIEPSSDSDSATIGSNKPYAAIQHFGGKTSPHVIRPREKKALAFGGRVVKQVNHPGSNIPARPYLPIDAQGNLQPEAEEAIMGIVNGYLRSLGA
jgi:phage virion morphogenesis protein